MIVLFEDISHHLFDDGEVHDHPVIGSAWPVESLVGRHVGFDDVAVPVSVEAFAEMRREHVSHVDLIAASRDSHRAATTSRQ